MDDLGVKVT
ncbi:hypothetical protein MKD33_02025, partial [Chromobacterium piscinae]